MPTSDVWSLIISHVHGTQNLIKLRLANRMLRDLVSMEYITGIPTSTAHILWSPKVINYGKIRLLENEDTEGTITNEGNEFWVWVYADPIRLTQYVTTPDRYGDIVTKYTTTFKTVSSNESLLWLKITANGLICIITASDHSNPLVLTVFRRLPDQEEETLSVVMRTTIERTNLMRRCIFVDESDDYLFSRNSLQCMTWNEKSFIVMTPVNKKDTIMLMEIGSDPSVEWTTMHIPLIPLKRIGCIRQIKNIIYVIPDCAGSVYAADLNETRPSLVFLHSTPMLPSGTTSMGGRTWITQVTIASVMDVSENGKNFVVWCAGAKKIFHLTETTVRQLDRRRNELHVSGFSFIGNRAVVCFFKASNEYCLYNLETKDRVRSFRFDTTPCLSLMGKNCIWSVGPKMSVSRQIASPQATV